MTESITEEAEEMVYAHDKFSVFGRTQIKNCFDRLESIVATAVNDFLIRYPTEKDFMDKLFQTDTQFLLDIGSLVPAVTVYKIAKEKIKNHKSSKTPFSKIVAEAAEEYNKRFLPSNEEKAKFVNQLYSGSLL